MNTEEGTGLQTAEGHQGQTFKPCSTKAWYLQTVDYTDVQCARLYICLYTLHTILLLMSLEVQQLCVCMFFKINFPKLTFMTQNMSSFMHTVCF